LPLEELVISRWMQVVTDSLAQLQLPAWRLAATPHLAKLEAPDEVREIET